MQNYEGFDVIMNFFDYAKAITSKKSIKFNSKECPSYMLLLHFSHDKSLLELCNKINEHMFRATLDNELVYKYFFDKVPKGPRYIRWVKKNKEKDKRIQELMQIYNCSSREAQESLL